MSDSNRKLYLLSPGLFTEVPQQPNYIKCEEAYSVFQNKKVCSFTGYRPEKMPFQKETDSRCTDLKYRLCQEIEDRISQGYTIFISGMARGADIWAAEMVLHLARDSEEEIELYAAVPCPGQSSPWLEWEKERYNEALCLCKGVFVIENSYTRTCMMKRNAFLVEHADCMISVYDGKSGGTAATLRMAGRKGIDVFNIEP